MHNNQIANTVLTALFLLGVAAVIFSIDWLLEYSVALLIIGIVVKYLIGFISMIIYNKEPYCEE
jgi:hypothetical protein